MANLYPPNTKTDTRGETDFDAGKTFLPIPYRYQKNTKRFLPTLSDTRCLPPILIADIESYQYWYQKYWWSTWLNLISFCPKNCLFHYLESLSLKQNLRHTEFFLIKITVIIVFQFSLIARMSQNDEELTFTVLSEFEPLSVCLCAPKNVRSSVPPLCISSFPPCVLFRPPRWLGHWDSGTLSHWDTGTPGHRNARTLGDQDTWTLGDWDTWTLGWRDTGAHLPQLCCDF